jgi:peptide/nickel transport system substrate-binding protein
MPMKRRTFLKSALAGATALAAPSLVRAETATSITFVPHADLASLDPVWTTADVTRNFSLAVYDTLFGYDAAFKAQPQMVEGYSVDDDGKQWDLTLRDGLKFHDGTPVLARDGVATIQRWAKRYPLGQALIARTDELSAVSDKAIRFRLKKPFPLLPDALAEPYCSIMPERLAKTDAFEQIKEAVGSGPFKFVASERIPGQRVVFEKNPDYAPRPNGKPSFSAGPKVAYVERVVWNFVQDPGTASAALERERSIGGRTRRSIWCRYSIATKTSWSPSRTAPARSAACASTTFSRRSTTLQCAASCSRRWIRRR